MADDLVVLEGGSRDGESTRVADGVRRVLAASDAPGLLDVYEADGLTNDEGALVLVFAGQEPSDGIAPELLHLPSTP